MLSFVYGYKVTPHFPDGELQNHSFHIQVNKTSLEQYILILSFHVQTVKVLFPLMFSDQDYLFIYLHTCTYTHTHTEAKAPILC